MSTHAHARAHLPRPQVDRTIEFFDVLLALHRDVSQRSRALHASCEQLVKEKDQLTEFADAIRTRLKFFDEFETVSAQVRPRRLLARAQVTRARDADRGRASRRPRRVGPPPRHGLRAGRHWCQLQQRVLPPTRAQPTGDWSGFPLG